MKAILVDDERWILELLKNSVPWGELGVEIIGECIDGELAQQMAMETCPDLIVSDIRMPGMDGLQLIAAVKEKLPNVKFIIISGHQDFEYAKAAVKLGVSEYILKPIDEVEIIESIKTVASQFHMKENEHVMLTRRLQQGEDALRRGALLSLFSESRTIDESQEKYLNDHFPHANFRAQILKFSIEGAHSFIGSDELMVIYKQYESDFIIEYPPCVLETMIHENGIITIHNYPENLERDIQKFYEEYTRSLKAKIAANVRCNIKLGIGERVDRWGDCHASIRSAQKAIQICIIKENDDIYLAPLAYKISPQEVNILTLEEEQQYRGVCEKQDIEGIEQQVNALLKNSLASTECIDFIFYLSEMLVRIYFKVNQEIRLPDENDDYELANLRSRIEECVDITGVIQEVLAPIRGRNQRIQELIKTKTIRPVLIAKEYIAQNFASDISLSEISAIVYLNSAYFSSMFKKETGYNYIDFLHHFRINVAKDLLKRNDLSIIQIAERVGYKDSRYFSKLFKKQTGVNPTEYRNYYL